MSVNERNGKLVASFPVEDSDQIMLVTDKGQLIRCPVEDIRIAGTERVGAGASNRKASRPSPVRPAGECGPKRAATGATTFAPWPSH